MSESLDGYVGDVAYAAHYHRATAPAWLHFVATALGRRAPDPSRPYRWCELGCGPGFGASVLAAANPHAVFHAVDFNAGHIRAAQARADAAGLKNIRFEQASFVDVAARAAVPGHEQYDYIVLTGVYGWISDVNQAAIRAIVQRDLRPGGIVHLAYPCLPGMAAMTPLRNLFRAFAGEVVGSASERAAHALARVRQLGHAGAAYLADFPALLAGLDQIAPDQVAAIAHDYLAEHWRAQDVGDVVAAFESIGCEWVGSAQPADNIDAVCLPAGAVPLIHAIESNALRESARAFAANQALRADIYQKRSPDDRLPAAAHRGALMAQRLAGPAGSFADDRARRVVADDAYAPLRARLSKGALSFAEAMRLPGYAAQPGALNSAFQLLAGAGQVMPVLAAPPDPQVAYAFNRGVARAVLQGQVLDTLAAPALGAGIAASLPQMAALLALHDDVDLSGVALRQRAWACACALASAALPDGPGKAFVDALAEFEVTTLPAWRQLGVLP